MAELTKVGIVYSDLTGEVYVVEWNKRGAIKQKRLITETFDMIAKARANYLDKIKELDKKAEEA